MNETLLKIPRYSDHNRVWNYVLKIKVNGDIEQFAGWKPIFRETTSKALVFHFGGPLGVQPLRFSQFSLKENKPELHVRFATPGQGEFSTVSLGNGAIPQNIEPIAFILWPGANVPTMTVKLLSRC